MKSTDQGNLLHYLTESKRRNTGLCLEEYRGNGLWRKEKNGRKTRCTVTGSEVFYNAKKRLRNLDTHYRDEQQITCLLLNSRSPSINHSELHSLRIKTYLSTNKYCWKYQMFRCDWGTTGEVWHHPDVINQENRGIVCSIWCTCSSASCSSAIMTMQNNLQN